MIEVKNITKIYGKKKNAFKALDGVSLDIEKGSSVAVLGKSGSGKSTLMHAISGLVNLFSQSEQRCRAVPRRYRTEVLFQKRQGVA